MSRTYEVTFGVTLSDPPKKDLPKESPKEFDKASWGDGLWTSEPDRKEWTDKGTWLVCLAVRNPALGHWCGYVGIPKTHPMHGKHYDDVDVNVHGGLTYSNSCSGHICHVAKEGDSDNLWWLGFDCAHLGDSTPMMLAMRKTPGWPTYSFERDETYKPLHYVEVECESLAKQLMEITP